jgi:dGTPase
MAPDSPWIASRFLRLPRADAFPSPHQYGCAGVNFTNTIRRFLELWRAQNLHMNWNALLCRDRLGGKSITPDEDVRTVFEADFDRVVFSGGFRRLSRKTQVHPFADDHVHTRLTHSLEVARVGRSLGKALGREIIRQKRAPDEVTQETPFDMASIVAAACLAHDIGNPPFGHAGEDAMIHWFRSAGSKLTGGLNGIYRRDLEIFDGNAQGFRMLTQTENHLFSGGLRLTYAALGTFLKYPWSSAALVGDQKKFGAFLTEDHILKTVAETLGLVPRGPSKWCRHPLAFLVEAADDICYATLDLEDAVEMGILRFSEAKEILLLALSPDVRAVVERELESDSHYRVNFTRMRGPVFTALIAGAVESFMANYAAVMDGTFDGELLAALDPKDRRQSVVKNGKKKAGAAVYPTRRKVELELGCYAIFDCLLEAHLRAGIECVEAMDDETQSVGPKSALVLKLLGTHAPNRNNPPPPDPKWTHYACMRRMVDYVSGMTDNYANTLAGKLRGNFSAEYL